MDSFLTEPVRDLAYGLGPEPDEHVRAMDERADREGFPTVGPAIGRWLAVLTRLSGARRAFEFGSGFGYSAYWIAREVPADGTVVLTEIDEDELADARERFESAGLADRARFEHGDALERFEATDGEFDLILLDHEKDRYVEAFDLVRDRLTAGGLVVADNALTATHLDPADIAAVRRGDEPAGATEESIAVAEYLGHVDAAADFQTVLLPLGDGVAISLKQ